MVSRACIALMGLALAASGAQAFPAGAPVRVDGNEKTKIDPLRPKCLPGDAGCGHSHTDFDHLLGKRFMQKLTKEDEETDNFFTKSDLPLPSRVIYPGQAITKDLRRDRLNVHVNNDGVAQRVDFG